MNKTFFKIVVIAMFALALAPALALAQGTLDLGTNGIENTIGLGNQDPRTTAASVIKVLMGFLGIIAVVIILLGGFKWMTAGGGEDKVAEAKKLMTAGVVGLAIILAAWGITVFVLNSLLSATGANTAI